MEDADFEFSSSNMGAEVGATTSLFPFASSMVPYLEATHRHEIAVTASTIASSPGQSNLLQADSDAAYDEIIEIDLSTLEPHINGYVLSEHSLPFAEFCGTLAGAAASCSTRFRAQRLADDGETNPEIYIAPSHLIFQLQYQISRMRSK